MAVCCSRRCAAVHTALVAPPVCAIPDCMAPVSINLGLKIVRHYCCIKHARLGASRGTFTFACDGPNAPHGVSSCVLAACLKIPTNGSEFCCITHAYAAVPSVLPSVASTAEAAAATIDAVATAATIDAVATAATASMASLRTSLAELQVELEAHRSEHDDLLRRQAGASPPPSPPQSCPSSTPEYFSSTEPIRPPPPPRGLVSANTRSATAISDGGGFHVGRQWGQLARWMPEANARPATAAAATASDVITATAVTTDTSATSAHAVAVVTTVPQAAAPAAAADYDRPTAASTLAAESAVAAAAATASVAAAPITGRRKRFDQGYAYTARDIAKKVFFISTEVTIVKREAPSSYTRAMSAKMRADPQPPPSAPPSPASSPEPSRPSTPPNFPPPPAPPARLLDPLPAFPRPPAPATYAAPDWWAAAGRVRVDMHKRIVELKRAIVRLDDHDDRLRRAMVMHTTINRIAAHQMQVLLGEDHWDATLSPYSTFLPRVATPAPHAVWSGTLGACNRCSGNPVDTGNGHGPGNHLHRQCTRAHPPPTRPATGTAVTIATVIPAVGTAAAARPHGYAAAATAGPPAATFNAVATAATASLTDAARPAVTTATTASIADAARPAANTAATQPAAAINAVTAAIDQPPPPRHSAPPSPPSSPEPSRLTTPYNAAAAVAATADTTEAAAADAAETAAAPYAVEPPPPAPPTPTLTHQPPAPFFSALWHITHAAWNATMHALHGNGLLAPVAPAAIVFAYSWHMTHAAWNALMHALHGNGPSTPLLFALFCCYGAVSVVIAVIHRLWPEPLWSFKTRHNAPRHPWTDFPPAPHVLSAQPPAPREPRWRSGRPP